MNEKIQKILDTARKSMAEIVSDAKTYVKDHNKKLSTITDKALRDSVGRNRK